MRLVCPNCGAQYEVDDRVIPDSGRDVQCSACGHAWYQMPPNMDQAREPLAEDLDDAAGAEDDLDGIVADEVGAALEAERPVEAEARDDMARIVAAAVDEPPGETLEEAAAAAADDLVAAEAAADELADEVADGLEPVFATAPGEKRDVVVPPAPRRGLDEDLRAILQEEAEREIQARAAERGHEPQAMETQPDLGLDTIAATDQRRRLAGEPMAGFGPDEDDDLSAVDTALVAGTAGLAAAADEGAKRQPRRELFPDIEEINSTLDGYSPGERLDRDDDEPRGRAGFSRAFLVVILLTLLALALYLAAPRLAIAVPALEPVLSAYVGAVNGLRAALDGLVRGLTGSIEGS